MPLHLLTRVYAGSFRAGSGGSVGFAGMQSTDADQGRADWPRVVTVFWITSMVEGLGVSQVFSYLAPYLRIVGVPDADRAAFVGLFWASAGLSVATAALVWFGADEVRPAVVPSGRVLSLAYGALRGVLGDPTVRRIFAIYGVAFLASQMSRPYQALIVEGIVGPGPGLTASIGLVAGPAALVGAAVSPLGGIVGDRIGFRPVLLTALVVGGIALLAVPLAPTI